MMISGQVGCRLWNQVKDQQIIQKILNHGKVRSQALEIQGNPLVCICIEIYSNAIKTYTTAAKTQYVPSFQAPWLLARQKRHVSVGGFKAMATLLTFNELIRHRNTQQRSSSAESQKT